MPPGISKALGPQKLIERLRHQRSVLGRESVSVPSSKAWKRGAVTARAT